MKKLKKLIKQLVRGLDELVDHYYIIPMPDGTTFYLPKWNKRKES